MLDTYSGSAGLFLKGTRYDVPDDLLKLLPKGSYKKTCAPWEDHVDKQAIELTAAQNKASALRGGAERFAAEAEGLKQKADSLVKPTSQKQADAKKAEQLARQEIARAGKAAENAKKAPSKDNIKKAADLKTKAWQLARENERKSAEFQLAHSELSSALARAELKRLDAEDAKKQARTAAKVLKQLKEKSARAKAKADAEAKEAKDAKSETEQPIDGQIDQPVEQPVDGQIDQPVEQPVEGKGDKPIAERQAAPAGQAGQ